jgi:hypothetical protein
MRLANLDKRLSKLEGKHVIASLADFVLWMAKGKSPGYTWDPTFEAIFDELFHGLHSREDGKR